MMTKMVSWIILCLSCCIIGLTCAAQITIRGKTYVNVGDALELICNGTDVQTPLKSLDWFKDGTKLSPNDRIAISVTSKLTDRVKTVSSTLRVLKLTTKDTGTYVCRVSNQMISSVNVHVSGPSATGTGSKTSLTTTLLLLTLAAVFNSH